MERTAIIAAVGLAIALSLPASAQSLSPMRQVVTSFTDEFAIRVFPKNPYRHRIRMEVRVYDQNFRLIPAHVSPKVMLMGAGSSRPVTVVIPFGGKEEKRVRICAESIPFTNRPQIIKAQVCGRFYAIKRN
jgi:hypothetical protein